MNRLPAARPLTGYDVVVAHNALSVVSPDEIHYWEKLLAWSQLAAGAYAQKTTSAWQSDWKRFTQFCVDSGRAPLPATAETVRLFILAHVRYIERDVIDGDLRRSIDLIESELDKFGVKRSGAVCRITTLERWLSSISAAHQQAGLHNQNPRNDALVKMALRMAKRVADGNPRQKDPVRLDDLKKIFALSAENLRDEQDKLIALVGYQTGVRSAALSRIGVSDLHWDAKGVAQLDIWRDKTDQGNTGRWRQLSAGTSALLRSWIDKNGITAGPVFRGVIGHDLLLTAPLTTATIRKAVKRVMARIGEGQANVAAHSLRIGGAQDLRAQNYSSTEIMAYGGWKSERMPARYSAKLEASEEGIVNLSKEI